MRSKIQARSSWLLAGLALGWLASGCHEYVNPWTDNTVGTEAVTTASVAAAEAQHKPVVSRQREYAPAALMAQDGSVRHFPLWFEDPFEDRGSDDGRFAWTYEDYVAAPYGLARMVLNTLALPISALVHPPVPHMVSDGVTSRQALGYDHDPEWHPEGGVVVPPDIIEAGAVASAANPPPGA